MSMIDEVEKLRGLEMQATPGKWLTLEDAPGRMTIISNPRHPIWEEGLDAWGQNEASETPDAKFISASRNLAPAMLDVLASFRVEDAEKLAWILSETIDNGSELRGMLERFQHMAALMEKEEQG